MKYTEIRGVSKPLHIFPIVSPTGTIIFRIISRRLILPLRCRM